MFRQKVSVIAVHQCHYAHFVLVPSF